MYYRIFSYIAPLSKGISEAFNCRDSTFSESRIYAKQISWVIQFEKTNSY